MPPVFDTFCDVGGKGYDPEKADYSGFKAWLQCYCVDGMKSIRDHNGRTMWFKVSSRRILYFNLSYRIYASQIPIPTVLISGRSRPHGA